MCWIKKRSKNDREIKEDETASPINISSDDNKPGCSSSNTQIEFQETESSNYDNALPKSQDRKSSQKKINMLNGIRVTC